MQTLKFLVVLVVLVALIDTSSASWTSVLSFWRSWPWRWDYSQRSMVKTAVCKMQPNPNYTGAGAVTGKVTLSQERNQRLELKLELQGFPNANARHGFHIHTKGDITGGCESTGGHYNPTGVVHGSPYEVGKHFGALGNIETDGQGRVFTTLTVPTVRTSLFDPYSVVGRSIVIHAGEDDLGRGGDAGSLASGNAGPRMACCVIGTTDN